MDSHPIKLKLYRHYKQKPYKMLGVARHSETLEKLAIYETRYENELGKLWARPLDMFQSQIEVNGISTPRFAQVEFEIIAKTQMNDGDFRNIDQLLGSLFDQYDPQKTHNKIQEQAKILLLSAYEQEKFVGFKLGYQIDSTNFYSWLGGIEPSYQGIGLGQALIDQQIKWATSHGYKKISTKTMNKWQSMLILNIRNGFQITAIEEEGLPHAKILLEKSLI